MLLIMMQHARKLVFEKSILETPEPKRGKTLTDDVKVLAKSFFYDDEYS